MATREQRRTVVISGLVPHGRAVKLWAFGYADIAATAGVTEDAVRQEVSRRNLDPSDLRSLVSWCGARRAAALDGTRPAAGVTDGEDRS